MNTLQLKHILSSDPFIKSSFGGVYACDQLSSITVNSYPKSFVINTDPSNLPGTHWLALYFTDEMNGEFFDSYGHVPDEYNKHVINFIDRNAIQCEHNKKELQSDFSSVCGQYCIYYLFNRCRNIPMYSIVNKFSLDKLRNDQFVYDFVKYQYRKAHPSVKQEINFVLTQIGRQLRSNKK